MSLAVEAPVDSPQTRLARVVQESNLAPATGQELLEAFLPEVEKAWNLSVEAKSINVTDPSQADEIKRAHEMRMKLRDVRIAGDKKRKSLKEESLRKGQAIDKVAKVIALIVEPAETKLLEMETIVERLEAERVEKVRLQRSEQLLSYGVNVDILNLGQMEEPAFARMLEDAKLASEARQRQEREAEEKRAKEAQEREAERLRLKAENERLREENAAKQKEADAAKAEKDRLEREQREREAAARKKADDEAKAKRKADRAPVAQRVRSFAAAIAEIQRPPLPDDVARRLESILTRCVLDIRTIAEELER